MSTVIIVAVIAVICVFGIKSYVKKLSYGCCGAGDEPAAGISENRAPGRNLPASDAQHSEKFCGERNPFPDY